MLKQVFHEIDSSQVTKIRARFALNNFRNIDDCNTFLAGNAYNTPFEFGKYLYGSVTT